MKIVNSDGSDSLPSKYHIIKSFVAEITFKLMDIYNNTMYVTWW